MHVHAGVLDFAVVAAYLILFSALWRFVAARYSDRPIGQAMAAIF